VRHVRGLYLIGERSASAQSKTVENESQTAYSKVGVGSFRMFDDGTCPSSRGLTRRLRCAASAQITQVEFQMSKETNLRIEAESKNKSLVEEHEEAVKNLNTQLKEKDSKLEQTTAQVLPSPGPRW